MASGTAFHLGRKTLGILSIAVVCGVLASLLPENSYQRWQLLDDTIHARSRWIYERIHYDPTPIDVVFVGPSRIGAGVSAPRLSARLTELGRPSQVVNFSLPENGRNINAAIVEELLKTKTPKLIVIGIIEKPSRFGHPAFKYIAPRKLIVNPGYFGNIDYFADLIYLPLRQLRLFSADIWPGGLGLTKIFDPAKYRGSTIETTGDVILPDGTVKNGTQPASAAELTRGVTKLEQETNPPILGKRLAEVEFGDERYFIRLIVADARAKGVRVAFLALPYYTGTPALQEKQFYETYGPIWNASFVARRADWYSDYAHLNSGGAQRLTDWLAPRVAHALEQSR